jgi:aminoglycoside phosphotransferase (APT) family kinase protein
VTEWSPPTDFEEYHIVRILGRGAMGQVYLAEDTFLLRPVAVKFVTGEVNEAAREQFFVEARAVARLSHPNVVAIHRVGEVQRRPYLVSELIRGLSLDRLDKPMAWPRVLELSLGLARGLAAAHRRGVLHRDLKPQNVMVGAFGEVYVMDWGVEGVAGTPAFRAPEPLLDQRSDVYALGALLQFVLPADASPALRAIAAKAMRPEPAARYRNASELLADLDRFQEGAAVEAWAEPWWHQVRRVAGRNAVLLWLLAAYAAAKFLVLFYRGF